MDEANDTFFFYKFNDEIKQQWQLVNKDQTSPPFQGFFFISLSLPLTETRKNSFFFFIFSSSIVAVRFVISLEN